MKLVSKKTIKCSEPVPVYDVIQATPHHNFVLSSGLISHNCALMDEMEFMKGQNDNISQSKVLSFYNTIKRRMESRFILDGGKLQTMMFLISSKQEQNNFLEQYTKTIKDEPGAYVVDKPIWEVKPANRYSGNTFRVAVGNMEIPSAIVKDDRTDEELIDKGYSEVLNVPIEYSHAFELDIKSALHDIAGKSTTEMVKYISPFALKRCYRRKFRSPFAHEIIKAGIDDAHKIEHYFNAETVPTPLKNRPGYIHVDLALKHDKAGISYVIPVDNVLTNSYVNDEAKNFINSETQAVVMELFSFAVKADVGSEISLQKIRNFFIYLRENGFNISHITYDGFQSADSVQLLKLEGFNAEVLSVDRNNRGYDALRSAINDGRIILGDLSGSLLETELINLEKTPKGKIDHPVKGSKDIADGLAGATYDAIQNSNVGALAYEDYISSSDVVESLLEDSYEGLIDLGGQEIVGQYSSLADLIDNIDSISDNFDIF